MSLKFMTRFNQLSITCPLVIHSKQSCAISDKQQQRLRNELFTSQPLFNTPLTALPLWLRKPEWWASQVVTGFDMCSHLDTISACNIPSDIQDYHCSHAHPLSKLFVCLVFNGTFSTYRLYRAIGIWHIYCVGPGETKSNINKPNKRKIRTHSSTWALCRCHQRSLSIANHLASTDNLNKQLTHMNI